MKEKLRIVKNTGILLMMEGGIRVLEVLTSIILARYLAPQGFGLMAFALAFVSLFGLLSDFGMGTLVTRNVARDPTSINAYMTNGLVAKTLLSFVALTGIGLVLVSSKFPFEKGLVIILAALLVFLEDYLYFVTAFFRGVQQMASVALITMTYRAGWVVAALAAILWKGNLAGILGMRLLISLFVIPFALYLVHSRLRRLSWSFDPAFMGRILKTSLPFALFQVSALIYVKIDLVMLSFMKGDIVTGWYACAQRFRMVFGVIPSSVREATLPAMSQFFHESPSKLSKTIEQSCKYLWLIALPVAALVSFFSEDMVRFVYGDAYQRSAPAVQILMWTMIFSFASNIFTGALYAMNQETRTAMVVAFGALFNIAANFIVIPYWGHVGAAVATVTSEIIVCFIQFSLLRKLLPAVQPFRQFLKVLGPTLLMMTFVLSARGWSWGLRMAVALVIYALCLLIFRVVGREEWALIGGIFRPRHEEKTP